MDILENYLLEITKNDDFQYLSEDIKSVVSKLKSLNLKNIVSSLQASAKSKDLNKIRNTINLIKLPTVPNENIIKNVKKISPDFDKSYKLSKKVISNSVPSLSDKVSSSIAIAVAVKSTLSSIKNRGKEKMSDDQVSHGHMEETRENLITTVKQLRKYIGTGVDADAGAILGAVIVIIFLITGIVTAISYGAVTLIPLAMVGGLLMVLKNLLSE